MKKADIVNALIERHGLSHYLEIATPTTGFQFNRVEGETLRRRERLVYNCPDDHDDGEIITYRTPFVGSWDVVAGMIAEGRAASYDIVFVDPHHTMICSAADLVGAWQLLSPGGWLVVHDCSPATAKLVAPEFHPGAWCGVTYAAFIDFLYRYAGAAACTVDSDFGCGVMRKPAAGEAPAKACAARDALELGWVATLGDHAARFAFFNKHRTALLNLLSVEAFRSAYLATLPNSAEDRICA